LRDSAETCSLRRVRYQGSGGSSNGDRNGKVVQPDQGLRFYSASGGGGKDVFVHISAVERAGLSTLNEGQQVEYEIVDNRGKSSAENLKVK
jgi:CspA family cold shock protein